ncbi:MAG TPA: hypothetical protein GXX25_09460 [Desulfotomaculum sp.]|nr:hypothetical protein [Desulfotomaculum sp.]
MARDTLVEQLLELSPAELLQVLATLVDRLRAQQDVELAREIIEQYRPALEELASR